MKYVCIDFACVHLYDMVYFLRVACGPSGLHLACMACLEELICDYDCLSSRSVVCTYCKMVQCGLISMYQCRRGVVTFHVTEAMQCDELSEGITGPIGLEIRSYPQSCNGGRSFQLGLGSKLCH